MERSPAEKGGEAAGVVGFLFDLFADKAFRGSVRIPADGVVEDSRFRGGKKKVLSGDGRNGVVGAAGLFAVKVVEEPGPAIVLGQIESVFGGDGEASFPFPVEKEPSCAAGKILHLLPGASVIVAEQKAGGLRGKVKPAGEGIQLEVRKTPWTGIVAPDRLPAFRFAVPAADPVVDNAHADRGPFPGNRKFIAADIGVFKESLSLVMGQIGKSFAHPFPGLPRVPAHIDSAAFAAGKFIRNAEIDGIRMDRVHRDGAPDIMIPSARKTFLRGNFPGLSTVPGDRDKGGARTAGIDRLRIGGGHLEELPFITESRIGGEGSSAVPRDVPAVIHQRDQKIMCPRKNKGAFHHDLRHAGTGADPCSARVKGLHDVVVIRCIPVIGIAGIDGDAAGRLERLFIDLMGPEVVAGINLPDVDPFPFVASPVQTVEILQRAGNDEKILPRPKRRIDVFVAVGIMVFDCCFVQAFRPVAPCLSVVGAALDGFVVEESVELAGIGKTLDDFRRGFL